MAKHTCLAIMLSCALLGTFAAAAIASVADFKSPFDGSKMEFPLKAGETETPQLKEFKATGNNPYRGDAKATAEGKELYEQWCQACHNSDGSGRMGPQLIGKDFNYPQTATDPGMFSIIYGGAKGAMQPFSTREVTQDEMLKIITYVRTLDK
jgi:cytochrome c-L